MVADTLPSSWKTRLVYLGQGLYRDATLPTICDGSLIATEVQTEQLRKLNSGGLRFMYVTVLTPSPHHD